MSQHGQWPCGCGRRDHPPGACPKPMTATEIISRTAEAAAAFEEKKAVMMQSLVDRTMEVMRKRGIHVPSDWRIPVAAAKINVEPEIPVTEEMIAEARGSGCLLVGLHDDEIAALYHAMAAKAPKESSTWAFQEHRIAVSEAANLHLRATVAEKSDRIAALEADLLGLRGYCEVLEKRDATRNATIAELEHDIRMLMSDKVGDHDYHGPVKDGKAVPDESHERFHGSIGDVLSGNIIRPARDQMEKALADARAKDGKGVPSIPTGGRSSDPRRIGG